MNGWWPSSPNAFAVTHAPRACSGHERSPLMFMRAVPVRRDVGEGSVLLAPILKLGVRNRGVRARSQLPIEHVQAVGVFERKGPEERGVNDGEDRGVHADAEREGQHGDGRIPAFLHKQPKREPEILEHGSPLAKTPVRRAG